MNRFPSKNGGLSIVRSHDRLLKRRKEGPALVADLTSSSLVGHFMHKAQSSTWLTRKNL